MRKIILFGANSVGVSTALSVAQQRKIKIEVVTELPSIKYLALEKFPELMDPPLVFEKSKSKFHK